jgi:hypothetical protein
MSESWPKLESREVVGGDLDWDLESLVEQIWTDLGGQFSRLAIRHQVADVVPTYQDARITTYIPIFVRCRTVEQLRTGLSGIAPQSAQ